MDYTPINQTVTLGPDNTLEEITISVLEDIFTESNDEIVCVRVVLPESSQAVGVLLNSSDTNFTIIDTNGTQYSIMWNDTNLNMLLFIQITFWTYLFLLSQ